MARSGKKIFLHSYIISILHTWLLHGKLHYIMHRVVLTALLRYPIFITNLSQLINAGKLFMHIPTLLLIPGNRVNVGFLIGQQYDLFTDAPLFDGTLPVIFTPEVKNIEPGPNLNMPGIRPIKYAPDYLNFYVWGSPPTNDFVYFRFPDVLLMKAEAILRGGTPTNAGPYGNTALSIVNAIRTDPSRGATTLSSIDLDGLLDERGRELWWENWRRQDMIRFKKFLYAFPGKRLSKRSKVFIISYS